MEIIIAFFASFLDDYAIPILLVILIGAAVFLIALWGPGIFRAVRHDWRMLKAYATAIRVTIRQERGKGKLERKIERLERKADKAREKRDAAQLERWSERLNDE